MEVRHEPDGVADKDDHRRLSRLDVGRIRFLRADLCDQGHRQGFRRRGLGGRLRAVPHARDALRRGLHLRPDRRQMGTQAGADARHRLLFADRCARNFFPQLHRLPRPARAVRRGDGGRMGARQLARDGVDPAAGARDGVGHSAMRLSERFPARGGRLRPALRKNLRRLYVRLAGDVPAQPSCRPWSSCSSAPPCRNRRRSRRRERTRRPIFGRPSRRTGASSSTWSS